MTASTTSSRKVTLPGGCAVQVDGESQCDVMHAGAANEYRWADGPRVVRVAVTSAPLVGARPQAWCLSETDAFTSLGWSTL